MTEVDKTAVMVFARITIRADQMGGAPCIRGLRIPVSVVVDMVAEGMAIDAILALYPDLEKEDIPEALRFAAEAVRERELPLREALEFYAAPETWFDFHRGLGDDSSGPVPMGLVNVTCNGKRARDALGKP